MTSRLRLPIAMLLLGGALMGCSRRAPAPTEKAATSTARTTEINEPPGAFDPSDPKHGTRKLMNLDAPVYVDGVETAVLRYGDLVVAPVRVLEGGTPEFSLHDYVRSIGLAPEAIKSVHLHGNSDRVASVEGSELVKEKDRFTFTFSSQTTGAAIQRWSTGGLKNPFVVHEIRKVSVFVNKAPTAIHPQRRCHLDASGACTDAVPYAEGAPVHGTRIYVDGKMVGFVKRRQIADAVIVGKTEAGDYKYNVARFVESLGVKNEGSHETVELVAGDDLVGRGGLSSELFFTLPKHNHGKVRVHVPAPMQADGAHEERDALVSSIHIFKSASPRDRALTAISEDTDLSVQLASSDGEARDSIAKR